MARARAAVHANRDKRAAGEAVPLNAFERMMVLARRARERANRPVNRLMVS